MRTFFMLYVVPCNALMSLRAKRGNLPEGNRIAFGKRCMPSASDVECATMRLAARYVPSARCGGICTIKKP